MKIPYRCSRVQAPRFDWQAMVLVALVPLACLITPSASGQGSKAIHRLDLPQAELTPAARLGERLFQENRLSNPGSNFTASCRSCHLPKSAPEGPRAYADSHPRSLMPDSTRGSKLVTLRNTPTLLDVAQMTRLNHDGQFASLEDLIKAKLTGTHLGWLPGDEERVSSEVLALLLNDTGLDAIAEGVNYLDHFKKVYGVDVEAISGNEAMDLVVQSLADYVRTLITHQSSPYDAFRYVNRLDAELKVRSGDTAVDLTGRLFGRLANQEGRALIKFPRGYNELAYQGYKIFFRTYDIDGVNKIGNCIACHYPPNFTDFSFHNTGVAQEEYDGIHGAGSFSRLALPATPVPERTRARPSAEDATRADLGYWNFVDLETSTLRRPDESKEAFSARMVGVIKTPGLRDLALTNPYMHNGAYATLEEAVAQKVRACALAREGGLRNADPEILKMNITEEDIAPLVAFLETLKEMDTEDFRNLLLKDVVTRQADSEGAFPGARDRD